MQRSIQSAANSVAHTARPLLRSRLAIWEISSFGSRRSCLPNIRYPSVCIRYNPTRWSFQSSIEHDLYSWVVRYLTSIVWVVVAARIAGPTILPVSDRIRRADPVSSRPTILLHLQKHGFGETLRHFYETSVTPFERNGPDHPIVVQSNYFEEVESR